ncbi:MAG TPA: pyridoxamine 5'-phosphate oxidase family protein [Galbitalea sp.]|nr:pyridoxamine 5'-phosphate oxidase family protein [Galbitalea sp.]
MNWEKSGGAHITWAHVDAALCAARTIWIASAGARSGHAAPVWFLWDGRRIVFSTGVGTRKGRDIAARPYVCLHLGDGDEVVIVEGRAEVLTDPVTLTQLEEKYAQKYVEPRVGIGAALLGGDQDTVYAVNPRRILAWSYGDVTTRTEWTPEQDSS